MVVEAGDVLICHVDSSAAGTQAVVGTNWDVIQTNIDGAVTLTGTQTLTNKTLTSPVINTPTGLVKADVGLANVDNTSDATKNAAPVTLTNKTISGGSNTFSNISNTAITGLGTMSTQNASAVAITGGTIDGVTINGGTF